MMRDIRRRSENQEWWEDKKVLIGGIAIVTAIIIVISMMMYSNNSKKGNDTNPSQIISLAPEDEIENNIESASSTIGNKVDNSQAVNTNVNSSNTNTNTLSKTNTITAKETSENIVENTISNQNEKNSSNTTKKVDEIQTSSNNKKEENNENIKLEWPIKGDILKAFSIDNLLYSSTLQEWTVHNGIDIKADKASAVCTAESGTVKSIKNDPRYGLTVVIEHTNGYKTIYSNLLTAEFVVEGEKVKKGQNIGTVGNTANFEVADDFHLHFGVMKDSQYVDPMIYLK